MKTNTSTQSLGERISQGRLGKGVAFLGCLGVLAMIIVLIVLGGFVYINGKAASQSEIFFRSPMDGERVNAGEPLEVRVLARDEIKILRVEFWVDGTLVETQSSTIPGGSNPFPLLTAWIPTEGSHTLTARAVNSKNESSQSEISIEAVTAADTDGDGVANAEDQCPDLAGSSSADGCPDRDSDGIADSLDACPDEAGVSESGCPEPGEGDRDGDGVMDEADACPDEPGSAFADGCPDADADGVGDAEDACPEEAGLGEDGCPIPGDADGDTVPDAEDACPHVWGLPENVGCPDVDGDGVIDSEDACPAEPGGADGCPEAGGSGVEPPEEEPVEDAGVEGDDDFFGDGGDWEAVDLVRIEAFTFSVTQDYDEISCYAGVVGRDMDRYGPFDSLGHHDWDIVEYLGGDNSRTLGIELGTPLVLRVECTGTRGPTESFDLGSFTRTYDETQWDGHVIEELSGATAPERGDPGHSFRMTFRLCHRTCDETSFPPPALRHYEERIGPFTVDFLGWDWMGNRDDIDGYRLYVNGHRRETIHNPNASNLNLRSYMPDCGERNEYTLTAYRFEGGITRESPPSNPVYIDGEACPRQVKVTFEELGVRNLHYIGGDMAGRGPIFGSFTASGNDMETLRFDGGKCITVLWVFNCKGYDLGNGDYSIQGIFNTIRSMTEDCHGMECSVLSAPMVNYVIIDLDEGDDLTFAASIWDEEAYGGDERLLHVRRTVSAEESLPAVFTMDDNNEFGNFTLRVRVEEVP